MSFYKTFRTCCLLIAAGALAGCAFQPLYGGTTTTPSPAKMAVQQVEVELPEGRLGQLVRNELLFLMNSRDEGALYTLDIKPSSSKTALFSNTVGRVTSYSYNLTASWVLTSKATGEVLTSGRSQAAASYNRTDQPFANERAERDAEERAARVLAENIATRISAYFATVPAQ